MPGSTANYAIPYPLGTDPPNVAPDIQALANKVDTSIPLPNVPNGYARLDGSGNLILANTQKFGYADATFERDSGGNQINMRNGWLQFFDPGIHNPVTNAYMWLGIDYRWPYISMIGSSTAGNLGGAGISIWQGLDPVNQFDIYSAPNSNQTGIVFASQSGQADRFRFTDDCKISFSGANASGVAGIWDTVLYRGGAGILTTDGTMYVGLGKGVGGAFLGVAASGDTVPRVQLSNNGGIYWGPGNAATDTQLYRVQANILQTNARIISSGDGSFCFQAEVPTSGGAYQPFYYRVSGDAQPRWAVRYDATLQWGPGGSTAPDTNLYRNSAGILRTDGGIVAATQFSLYSGGNYNRWYIGQNGDMHWSDGTNPSDAFLQRVFARGLQTNAWWIFSVGTDPTNVCISTQIDADANVRFSMDANGKMSWGPGGSGQDTQLLRASGGGLQIAGSAGNLTVGGSLYATTIQDNGFPSRLAIYTAQPSDCNAMMSNGWFYANSIANQPPNATCSQWLCETIMWGSSGYGKQIAYGLYTNEIWTRYLYASTWNPWVQVAGAPTGSGADWFGATAPAGYLLCDGSAISRTTYSALYAILGTAYGAGDGSTTFNLPDLRGRVIVGMASGGHSSVNALGLNDGAALANRTPRHNHTNGLTLPAHAHSHSLTLPNHYHNVSDPGHGHSVQSWQYATAGGGYSIGYSTSASGSYSVSPVGMVNNNGTGIAVYDVTQGALAINGAIGNNSSSPAIAGTIGPGGALGGADSPSYVTANKIIKT